MADCPQEQINRIWRLFAAQGIGDDMQIIESIAYHFLRRTGHEEHAERGGYPRPSGFRNHRDEQLDALLTEALDEVPAAKLLNECLIFQLETMQAGGRYPTPRHISRLMADLARTFVSSDDIIVADLACGSGGLLVEFGDCNVIGVEISINWARLAQANLLLHGMPRGGIYTGDALIVEANAHITADIIVMNPPFGAPMETERVNLRLGESIGTRSETVLALLALDSLRPEGVLAVLQPGGALFSTSSGEMALRKRLLNQNRLEAVIQLPKDAFQPYSQLQTYLLLARKAPQSSLAADAPVWFYEISHDGFGSGRNRQPQPERNQLPQLLAAVAAAQTGDVWEVRDDMDRVRFEIRPCETGGYRVVQPGEGRLRIRSVAGWDSLALWVTHLAEGTSHGLICDGALWQQSKAVELGSDVTLQASAFQIGDDSGESVEFAQEGRDWRLHLKSNHKITAVRSLVQDAGFLALVVFKEGDILSPLCLLEDVYKDFKPSSIALLPLETDEGSLVGQLLLWDCAKVKPLFFTSDDASRGWVLLANSETAILLGWEDGILLRAFAGPLTSAFAGEPWHRGAVVDVKGVRFGVAIGPAFIQDERQLDLTFDRYYLPDEGEPAVERSAAEILAALRHKQKSFTDRLNYLLGIVEMRPTPALPSPLVEDAIPLWPLNHNQRLIWQRIAAQIEESNGVTTAQLFRPEQLSTGLNVAEVQDALMLFEKMGLIVSVTVNGAAYYRRVTQRDVVAL